jgi:hypothetical protein
MQHASMAQKTMTGLNLINTASIFDVIEFSGRSITVKRRYKLYVYRLKYGKVFT